MQIETVVGKFAVTADKDTNNVTLSAERIETLISVLDSVELMAGALGEDQSFSGEDIHQTQLFGKTVHRATITRAQLTRYFEYEILNFLDYQSLTQMRKQQKVTQLN